MLRDGQPFFLDYQGGRKGALQYDIASLLYDAKADLPAELRQQLLDHYLDSSRRLLDLDREAFMQHYYAYVYVRIMQAMGAYGFRGFYERKPHFLQSVPYALKNLRWLLHNVELPIARAHADGHVQEHAGLGEGAAASARSRATWSCWCRAFHFTKACPRTKPGTAAASSSTAAACRIPAAKSASRRSPARTRR